MITQKIPLKDAETVDLEHVLSLIFAGGVLRAFGFTFVCVSIFCAVVAAGRRSDKIMFWVGTSIVQVILMVALDIATKVYTHSFAVLPLRGTEPAAF